MLALILERVVNHPYISGVVWDEGCSITQPGASHNPRDNTSTSSLCMRGQRGERERVGKGVGEGERERDARTVLTGATGSFQWVGVKVDL